MEAVLGAVCQHHPEQRLASWGIDSSGGLHILEATGLELEPVDGWYERGPAWSPVAGESATNQNYVKWNVRCTRPSCPYEQQVGQELQSRLADLLARMADAGIPERDVELSELLRGFGAPRRES